MCAPWQASRAEGKTDLVCCSIYFLSSSFVALGWAHGAAAAAGRQPAYTWQCQPARGGRRRPVLIHAAGPLGQTLALTWTARFPRLARHHSNLHPNPSKIRVQRFLSKYYCQLPRTQDLLPRSIRSTPQDLLPNTPLDERGRKGAGGVHERRRWRGPSRAFP